MFGEGHFSPAAFLAATNRQFIPKKLKQAAVDLVNDTEDKLQIKSLEFEKVRAICQEDKKKLEKKKNECQTSIDLVQNLIKQRNVLQSKYDEGKIYYLFNLGITSFFLLFLLLF